MADSVQTAAPETTTSTTPQTNTAPASTSDGTPVGSSAPAVQVNEAPATKNWRDDLAPELRDDANIKNFKDLSTFAKSHVELRKTLGERVAIPKADAPDDEKAAFFERLGIPKTYDEKTYNIKGPELPTGMEMDGAAVGEFGKFAHKIRLSPAQAQDIMNYYGGVVKASVPNYKADTEAAIASLGDEWGQALDRNLGLARRALNADFSKETIEKITRSGLENDPGFIKAMYSRGKGLVEDGVIPSEVAQGMNKNSAQGEIDTIMGDQKGPYYDKSHPGHDAAVAKVRSLNQLIYS